jgi:hypothetical protein
MDSQHNLADKYKNQRHSALCRLRLFHMGMVSKELVSLAPQELKKRNAFKQVENV